MRYLVKNSLVPMQLHISTGYEEMSQTAARFIAGYVSRHPEALLCMPSGDTPTGT
jgi:6-phosphogluconolactonase/glucosamine-6-phosphate isomerase/deaminase